MSFFRDRSARKKLRNVGFVIACMVVFVAFFATGNVLRSKRHSDAEVIADGERVEEDTDLTYYLKVKYDGVDRAGVKSSDAVTSEVRSDAIVVSDKIPDGLIFQGFVETQTGSIGAVRRSDNATACSGTVIDDTGSTTGWNAGNTEYVYHGLHYTVSDRTVRFKVKSLMAGCQLTVGIRTKTPTLPVGVERMDFYNTAGFFEGDLSSNSNTVHTYIGRKTAARYQVKYQYTGTVPDGAPEAPEDTLYSSGSTVGVERGAELDGYDFSGWITNDATVSGGTFTMPSNTVTFSGSFTPKTKYDVTYSVNGNTPDIYHVPKTKSYGAGDTVVIDSMAAGTVVDGYRFNGWSSSDVTPSDGIFTMPAQNVTLVGTFTRIGYTVSYQFVGSVMPPDASSLLPASSTKYPGDTVTLAAKPTASGYEFLGWYKDDNFEMPAENVVIKGEWAERAGVFRPTINQVISEPKEKYYKNDVVKFEITVSNPENYAISDVNVGIGLSGAIFKAGSGYTLRTNQLAQVATIPAHGSVKLYAEYTVLSDTSETLTNVAALKSATASNGYSMDMSDEARLGYTASVSFETSFYDAPVPSGIMMQLLPYAALIALGAIGGVVVVLQKRKK